MKKHTLILITLAILVGFGAFWLLGTNKAAAPSTVSNSSTSDQTSQSQSEKKPATDSTRRADCAAVDQPTITYADGNFSPACVTVKTGATITWVNKASQPIEVGTDPHPAHTGNREVSGGEFVLRVGGGSEATSTMTTVGSQSYHDHLRPDATGTIIVE